ncbi:uroporphyrinogen-III synthase [Bacillus horti]|uniref:Uroporphyrinogen-III synthase n=1 Tax=Caldalkalibacillus horti TaxID=77523 RepID=A0ABT9VTK3_9BACI|nr:uroporphyrinogen-III synthase [Bacillus horti]MDQ0164321.1 uroporphyrinogen-III synthase [Bacillus horti]
MSREHVQRSLEGKHIAVTRATNQAKSMLDMLEAKGATPYLFPLIKTRKVDQHQEIQHVLKNLESFSWIIFTSVNSVRYFMQCCREFFGYEEWLERPALKNIRIAAVGPITKEVLIQAGWKVDFMPSKAKQEELGAELSSKIIAGERVLFPKGNLARKQLKQTLEDYEIDVLEIIVYETVKVKHRQEDVQDFISMLARNQLDVLTFTSSSTIKHFMALLKENDLQLDWNTSPIIVACIGPITAQTAKDYGMNVHIEATPYTGEALVNEIEFYFTRKQV